MDYTVAGVFSGVSGTSMEDCVALAGRFEGELGYRPPNLETWVVRMSPGRIETMFWGQRKWLSGIWRGPSGRIYVSDMDKVLHHREPDPDASSTAAWTKHEAAGNMMGIRGIDDDYVMSWGLAEQSTPCVMLWEGSAWRRVGAPEFMIWDVHGSRRDLIFAVGDGGRIARWDGTRWTEMSTPATGTLNAVFCVDDDEVYACGRDRELLKGSSYGWTKVLDAEVGLHGVAKWRGEVWVGAAMPIGLCKLEDDGLVQVGPVLATNFDVRGTLLFTTSEHIAESPDGVGFMATPIDNFLEIVANDPPSWR
ncbi:MAG: hypothetical protein KF718_26450 [Polyangiaceae bacterium]|nr:hypothetical protein [Polyangiaceae bacterium]